MKEISIMDLKRSLSAFIKAAAGGASFIVTSHNKPVAELRSADPAYLHRGVRFGTGTVRPLFRSKTRGRYLEVLSDDRRERVGRPDGP